MLTIDHDYPTIHIHTLGQFEVFREGQSLVENASGSKKIWELFKFMLTHRERTFTPETLADQLWVSEDYSDPRSTLRRQMHRLRQALGENSEDTTVLFTNGYYKWNPNIPYYIDTDHFELLVKKAKLASPNEAIELYKNALGLYKGDYLPDCLDNHWVFSVRNHYRRIYLEAVVATIQLLNAEKMVDDVVALCQEAMKIDVYEEAFHIFYMNALAARGEQKLALEHYEHITGFFYREMGVKPSDEMKATYKRLLQSNVGATSSSVFELLQAHTPIENAFYCEPEVFKSIYELERRRCERSGHEFSISVLEVPPAHGFTYAQEGHRLTSIKNHLMSHLRKGDSFTKWNDQQFVVLLPGVDASVMENVLKRVLHTHPDGTHIKIGKISHLGGIQDYTKSLVR